VDTEFKVKAGTFEGPLELLLELIEKRKFHVSDVSLSQVADDFIAHTKSYEDFPMADSADFLLIASTLLLIKSKSLLPNLELSDEEKGSIEDLEKRLELYKKYKDAAILISKIFGKQPLYFAGERRSTHIVFAPTQEITPDNILNAIREVLNNVPRAEVLQKISVTKTISLEEMIESLRGRIEKSLRMSFRDFSGHGKDLSKGDKVTVIVSFLAMLELVKQGLLRAEQQNHFDEIEIESENVGVPTY
jgi:segregation and condensation protein A